LVHGKWCKTEKKKNKPGGEYGDGAQCDHTDYSPFLAQLTAELVK
jgi:hypothetical protein